MSLGVMLGGSTHINRHQEQVGRARFNRAENTLLDTRCQDLASQELDQRLVRLEDMCLQSLIGTVKTVKQHTRLGKMQGHEFKPGLEKTLQALPWFSLRA